MSSEPTSRRCCMQKNPIKIQTTRILSVVIFNIAAMLACWWPFWKQVHELEVNVERRKSCRNAEHRTLVSEYLYNKVARLCCFYLFCVVFRLFFHSRTRAYFATATKSGMPHFIAHTTVEFEIQLRHATRSAVFSCFVAFSHCFRWEITPTFYSRPHRYRIRVGLCAIRGNSTQRVAWSRSFFDWWSFWVAILDQRSCSPIASRIFWEFGRIWGY